MNDATNTFAQYSPHLSSAVLPNRTHSYPHPPRWRSRRPRRTSTPRRSRFRRSRPAWVGWGRGSVLDEVVEGEGGRWAEGVAGWSLNKKNSQ